MATLFDLKQKVEEGYAAQRTLSIPGSVASAILYKEDGYYVVTDLTEQHKECWVEWCNAVETIGEEWASSEDWIVVTRTVGANDLLTVKQVAKRLGVDQSTVRRWIKDGRLEAITLPCHGNWQPHRIRRSTLEQLLQCSSASVVQAS
jgi:excisionase family DNA binding protein